jgi:cell division septum initiation protein DivIVA
MTITMPDQSSAATEHAILQEITQPLESLPHDALADVKADFPTALRGYDRLAVDDYVRQTRQLVAELQATRSPEAAVRRALERVGEQISGILQRAHDTAEQITAQSRSEAEDRVEAAREEAARITAGAEQRVKDLDAETDRIWAERQQIVEDARELARHLLALAESAVDRFPAAEEPAAEEEPAAAQAEPVANLPGADLPASESLQVGALRDEEEIVALDDPEGPEDLDEEPEDLDEEPEDLAEGPEDLAEGPVGPEALDEGPVGPEALDEGPRAPFDGETTIVFPAPPDPKRGGDEHP